MENIGKGIELVLEVFVGIVGIAVTVVSIVVTIISILHTDRNNKHQKSNRHSPKCTDPQKLDQKSNDWRSVFLWLNIAMN